MTTPHTPPTQAELDALKLKGFYSTTNREIVHRLITEIERLRENPLIGTCVLCGLSIWSNQERMMDGRGMFHPGCVTRGEIARLTKEVDELRKDKERLDWLDRHSWLDNLKVVTQAGSNPRTAIDAAMQQKGEE